MLLIYICTVECDLFLFNWFRFNFSLCYLIDRILSCKRRGLSSGCSVMLTYVNYKLFYELLYPAIIVILMDLIDQRKYEGRFVKFTSQSKANVVMCTIIYMRQNNNCKGKSYRVNTGRKCENTLGTNMP